jgi:two-component system sensor histidine kinase RegB
LAAGATHELSTPLSTAALLTDELAVDLMERPDAQQNLALLKQQIQQCKASLSALLASAGHSRLKNSLPILADDFLQQTLERWRLLRPEVTLVVAFTGDKTARLLPEQTLVQALINLLNNSADASLAAGNSQLSLRAQVDDGYLLIEIEDEGAGFDEATRALAGRAVVSSKPDGTGLGLLLSNATLNRWGGTLSLHSRQAGGTLTRIVLPLSRLKSSAHEASAANC